MTKARELADLGGSATTIATQSDGYVYRDTLYYFTSGTFKKASYPWLRAIRVMTQGGGGGSGGCDHCGVATAAAAGGGGGGCYAESFLTDIESLASSISVTVGVGGAKGLGGKSPGDDGSGGASGGGSFFGSGSAYEVSASGGFGGGRGFDFNGAFVRRGANARRVGTGQIVLGGGPGGSYINFGTAATSLANAYGSSGGASRWGLGTGGISTQDDNAFDGYSGVVYGSGAGGSVTTASTTAQSGADGAEGAQGIVIVELYA